MSTRGIIKIEGVTHAEVYKHYDMYPSGIYNWLVWFNKDFTEKRGDDPSYKFAQLLRRSTEFSPEENYTGWGVVPYNSDMWQEYTYILRKDGTVDVYTYSDPMKQLTDEQLERTAK